MNPTPRTRRATTDDLEQLKALWETERLPVEVLEPQLTDFQVVENDDGGVAGAIALQVMGSQGRIHSETYADFGQTDFLRPRLWTQVQNAARSHGLFRLWTKESPPFWRKDAGFVEAPRAELEKLPEAFGPAGSDWMTLRLREQGADPEALERQFQVFKITEQEKRNRILRHARVLGFLGTLIAVLIFVAGFVLLVWVFKRTR